MPWACLAGLARRPSEGVRDAFGQAPLCLTLDLDSYGGSWTHVARFRGRSGWLVAVDVTIQSSHELMRGRAVAACDEFGNPYPCWQAEHLLDCDWSDLQPCFERPPEILDDLLCEEEGALYARWQRETNAAIAALDEAGHKRTSALEAVAKREVRRIDRHIADLRRRGRVPGVTTAQRETFDAAIVDLEQLSDGKLARMAEERAALRREIEAREEALWRRSDVLIEGTPLYTVRWAGSAVRRDHGLRFPVFQEDAYSIGAIQSLQAAAQAARDSKREWERWQAERAERLAKTRQARSVERARELSKG